MAISEKDYNEIIEDLMHMAETGSEDYLDSLAVTYIIMKKLGDRNADSWLLEMKEQGIPFEWASLRDGKKRNIYYLEGMVKNFVGICVYRNGKLSFKEKLYKRRVKNALKEAILDAEDKKRSYDIAVVYVLASLYTLSGDTSMAQVLIVGDETYKKLPLYVQWIEKYMWG